MALNCTLVPWEAIAIRLEAITGRLEAIALRLEDIAIIRWYLHLRDCQSRLILALLDHTNQMELLKFVPTDFPPTPQKCNEAKK